MAFLNQGKTQQDSKESIHTSTGFLKSWKFWVPVLILVLFVSYGVRGKKSQKVETKSFQEDVRQIVKPNDLKAAIASRRTAVNERNSFERNSPTKKARNYGTDIAVFLFKEKLERANDRHDEKLEQGKLGFAAGTKIPAYVSGTLFSFNVEAPVIALVSKDIEKDDAMVIPKDSKFLGKAGVLKSVNRINVHFDSLIFPDGREVPVRAIALSEDGSAGIKGRVSKHRDTKVLKAIGETALAGASLFAGGVSRDPFTYEDELRMNLARNLTQEARQDLRGVKVETSITVDSFTPIQVILLDGI